jgi:hypothetical protein
VLSSAFGIPRPRNEPSTIGYTGQDRMRTLMRAFRCACNLSATQTASKAGLCLPEMTSLGKRRCGQPVDGKLSFPWAAADRPYPLAPAETVAGRE